MSRIHIYLAYLCTFSTIDQRKMNRSFRLAVKLHKIPLRHLRYKAVNHNSRKLRK